MLMSSHIWAARVVHKSCGCSNEIGNTIAKASTTFTTDINEYLIKKGF